MASTSRLYYWFTGTIAFLLAIAAGCGVFIPGFYRDTPYFAVQAVAQDFVSLFIVVPVFLAAGVLSARGSHRAELVWLGSLVYTVYTYAIASFEDQFNALFLVYVALLGLSLYALIGGLVRARMESIKESFGTHTPVRTVSIYLGVLTFLFYALWLGEIIPSLLAGGIPQSVRDNGTPSNAVHVLDMAWILPAMGIASISLWRKQPLGYTLAGALLAYAVLLLLAIISMIVQMSRSGLLVPTGQVAVFSLVLLATGGMLWWYLRSLRQGDMS